MKTEELLARDAERELNAYINNDGNFKSLDSFEQFISETDSGTLYILLQAMQGKTFIAPHVDNRCTQMQNIIMSEYAERYD